MPSHLLQSPLSLLGYFMAAVPGLARSEKPQLNEQGGDSITRNEAGLYNLP